MDRNNWLQGLFVLLACSLSAVPALAADGLGTPQWVSSRSLSTDTGEFKLEWQMPKDSVAEFFRITET
jgi:hypothetical protein